MPFNGSGSFTPPSADFPAVALTLIESSKFNNVVNDIATGLSTCVTKDGQTTIIANLPMSGFRHTGVGAATAAAMYARVNEVQDGSLIYGGTAGGTADALTVTTVPTFSAYATGMVIRFKAGASPNTGAATLVANGISGAKAIQKDGAALAANAIQAGKFYSVIYDGTAFQLTKLGPTLTDAIGTAKGDIIAYTAAGAPARVAVGTNGQIPVAKSGATPGIDWDWINDFTEDTAPALGTDFVLTYDASAGDHKKVTGSNMAGTLATLVTTTGGTAILFQNIPSWAREIEVLVAGLSTSGTSQQIIQIGDAGGIENSGYIGVGTVLATGSSVSAANSTAGFAMNSTSVAAQVHSGIARLVLMDAATNLWAFSWVGGRDNAVGETGAGHKPLSATLTQLHITTAGGTDTFDANVGVTIRVYP